MLWPASEQSIRDSVKNAMALAGEERFESIAFPIVGAGSGGFSRKQMHRFVENVVAVADAAEIVPLSPPASCVVWTAACGPVSEYTGQAGFFLAFSGDGPVFLFGSPHGWAAVVAWFPR